MLSKRWQKILIVGKSDNSSWKNGENRPKFLGKVAKGSFYLNYVRAVAKKPALIFLADKHELAAVCL